METLMVGVLFSLILYLFMLRLIFNSYHTNCLCWSYSYNLFVYFGEPENTNKGFLSLERILFQRESEKTNTCIILFYADSLNEMVCKLIIILMSPKQHAYLS